MGASGKNWFFFGVIASGGYLLLRTIVPEDAATIFAVVLTLAATGYSNSLERANIRTIEHISLDSAELSPLKVIGLSVLCIVSISNFWGFLSGFFVASVEIMPTIESRAYAARIAALGPLYISFFLLARFVSLSRWRPLAIAAVSAMLSSGLSALVETYMIDDRSFFLGAPWATRGIETFVKLAGYGSLTIFIPLALGILWYGRASSRNAQLMGRLFTSMNTEDQSALLDLMKSVNRHSPSAAASGIRPW